MTLQTLLVTLATGLAAVHFIRNLLRDLGAAPRDRCGGCSSGGCPAARKG